MKKLLFAVMMMLAISSCYTVRISPELKESLQATKKAPSRVASLEKEILLNNYIAAKNAGFCDSVANIAAKKGMIVTIRSLNGCKTD